jgi:transglutaminase-like putative cysteine protease
LKKKVQSRDLVLDLSLIKVASPIHDPEKTRFLKVRIQGIEPSLIASDHRQRVIASSAPAPGGSFDVSVQVEDPLSLQRAAQTDTKPGGSIGDFLAQPLADTVSKEDLAPTPEIQSDHRDIIDQAKKIVAPGDTPLEKVEKLVRWTAENVQNKMQDSFTALSVLRSREGECQSHASLYCALARSQNIPTRLVTGIVYSDHMGFLYHAWAESHVHGWLAVDPTLNQIPADATHIKIATGETDRATDSLLKMIGNVKLEVLEAK